MSTNRRKRATAAVAAAALVTGLAGPAAAADLTFGELHPVTGPASFYGLVMSQTLKMLADQADAAGGVEIGGAKYMLQIETGDDQAQATTGVAALRKLLADNVHVIIGPLASVVAPAIKPVIDSSPNVLQIIDGSIADGVVNGRKSFRVQASADTYNNAVIGYLKSKNLSSVAIMSDRSHQGFMMSEPRMKKSLEGDGIKVLDEEYFKIGDTDFSAQLTKLKELNPAAIVLRGYPGEGALITKQAHQLGLTGQIVWEMGAPPSTVMKNIPATEMNGVVNCIPRMTADYIRLKVPNALALANAFKAKYGEEPGENAAFSNDAFWILVTAMQKAGSTDTQKVAAVLKELKVSDVPHLVIQYRPYPGGLLFKDGQADPPSSAQVWQGTSWQNMPGDHVEITTSN
jgi:branched-chain amino acid transport system substrate-binding protein